MRVVAPAVTAQCLVQWGKSWQVGPWVGTGWVEVDQMRYNGIGEPGYFDETTFLAVMFSVDVKG